MFNAFFLVELLSNMFEDEWFDSLVIVGGTFGSSYSKCHLILFVFWCDSVVHNCKDHLAWRFSLLPFRDNAHHV